MSNNRMDYNKIIDSANKKKRVSKTFDIQAMDEKNNVTNMVFEIRTSDVLNILIDYQTMKRKEKAYCIERGLGGLEIDEKAWQEERAAAMGKAKTKEDKERVESQRPEDLAEQEAEQRARRALLKELIPQILRDPATGKFIFRTYEQQKAFGEFVMSNEAAMKTITDTYVEIMLEYASLQESAKNLQAGKKTKDS